MGDFNISNEIDISQLDIKTYSYENNYKPDILNTYNTVELSGGKDIMKFMDTKSIVLYTALNKSNAESFIKGNYNEPIEAFEDIRFINYYQTEIMIKFSYTTTQLLDTLNSNSDTEKQIEALLKQNKIKKSELTEQGLIDIILNTTKITGIRFIEQGAKAITSLIKKNSRIKYVINPMKASAQNHLKILDTKQINHKS